MPWAMESSRKHFLNYLMFAIFHIGVVAAIALTFMIPYTPALLENSTILMIMQYSIFGAFGVGIIRIIKRIYAHKGGYA